MGVDTRACCMIGKYFEDFDSALNFLVERGLISEKTVEEAKDWGDLPDDFPVKYQTISCYSEEGGYLGLDVPTSLNLKLIEQYADVVRKIIGEDDEIGMHSFTYWY